MMNTVAPVWDGNETWLVLGGGGAVRRLPARLRGDPAGALPAAARSCCSALIFRGVAFEFRFKARTQPRIWWDRAFSGGSLLATFSQGVVLGAFIQGIPVDGPAYAGGMPSTGSRPFSLLTGLALVAGYALLGASWLI